MHNVHFVRTYKSTNHFLQTFAIVTLIVVAFSTYHVTKQEPWHGTACTLPRGGLPKILTVYQRVLTVKKPFSGGTDSAKHLSFAELDEELLMCYFFCSVIPIIRGQIRCSHPPAPPNTPLEEHPRIRGNKLRPREAMSNKATE